MPQSRPRVGAFKSGFCRIWGHLICVLSLSQLWCVRQAQLGWQGGRRPRSCTAPTSSCTAPTSSCTASASTCTASTSICTAPTSRCKAPTSTYTTFTFYQSTLGASDRSGRGRAKWQGGLGVSASGLIASNLGPITSMCAPGVPRSGRVAAARDEADHVSHCKATPGID